MRLFLRSLVCFLVFCCAAFAEQPRAGETLVILPFENESRAPGLEWIGESFPEILGQRINAKALYIVRREERLYAFDRLGIPANLRPSHATSYRVAREMDADYVVFGRYDYDGATFKVTAQLLRMKNRRQMPEITHSGPLLKLIELQTALAWDLQQLVRADSSQTREQFLGSYPSVRLDIFENYVRGLVAASRPEQIKHFKQALSLDSGYAPAMLQLGRTYYTAREYGSAVTWLGRIPRSEPLAVEASFYLGMAAFYVGDFARAESAFTFLSTQLPLSEVYNNLGVVTSRRGKQRAIDFFRKAVDADPRDPDYRFNLAVNLYRQGDRSGAAAQLRELLTMRSNDREAQALLENVTADAPSPNGALTFPLERIKNSYDETFFRHLDFELQHRKETPANSDPTQPLDSAH